jgi:DNA-binding transcriptional ArsR family regulator
MELEEVFSSKPRVKILKLLNKLDQLYVTDIARRVKLNFATVDSHLRLLESEGIVNRYLYGRSRLYSINKTSEKARAIQNLIQVWEQNKQ